MDLEYPMEFRPQHCRAKNRHGVQCYNHPSRGQQVCHMHGGKAPQALAKAEERMRELVHPAISALAELIEQRDLGAVRYALDYGGFKAKEKLETSGESKIVFEIEHVVARGAAVEPSVLFSREQGHDTLDNGAAHS
jgi:hypothetical protein